VTPHSGRIARLRASLRHSAADSLLVTSLPNVRYLCGFTGSAGMLLVTPREAVFLTDFRYRIQAAREVRGARPVEYPARAWDAVAAQVRRRRIRRLGFEPQHLTFEAHRSLAERLAGTELAPLAGAVEELRATKDEGEVVAIRAALRAAAGAFAGVAGRLAGRTERAAAEELEARMRRRGADGPAFPTILASGPQAALPHARPGGRRIRRGETVIVDFGARRDGYHCDLTRTLLPGGGEERARRIYRIVAEAQRRAIAAVRPGVPAREVDAAAREVISRAGFGERFGHGTGHGVGLEVHEKPNISSRSEEVLAAGMVFTVEPGIYVEKYGGVRIEDMVLVTPSGCEILSRLVPKIRP